VKQLFFSHFSLSVLLELAYQVILTEDVIFLDLKSIIETILFFGIVHSSICQTITLIKGNITVYFAICHLAFDKVNHRLLLKKLAKLGFGGSFLAWIRSYLTGRKQFLKASGSQSRRFSVRSGVPQGSH
jgi:hypothetical protein